MTLDELDRLAAEKIMLFEDIEGLYSFRHLLMLPYRTTWEPTRNIAQAWECLEKLGMLFRIDALHYDKRFRCELFPSHIYANDETAPLAIVKACLKAVGEKVD